MLHNGSTLMANLTSKQEAFVREYAVDMNATQAAARDDRADPRPIGGVWSGRRVAQR